MTAETNFLEKSSYQQRNVRGNSSTRSIFEGQTNWIGKANQSKYPSDSEPHFTVLIQENITIKSRSMNDRWNPKLDGLDKKRSRNFLRFEPFILARLDRWKLDEIVFAGYICYANKNVEFMPKLFWQQCDIQKCRIHFLIIIS